MDRHEKLRLKQEQRNADRDSALDAKQDQSKRKRKMIYLIAGSTLAVIVIVMAAIQVTPGRLDDFAECLTASGAVMYGAIDWCSYTQNQAGMFGKSFKLLDYRDYTETTGIKVTPTWIIGGVTYENVQSLDRLSKITGCKL